MQAQDQHVRAIVTKEGLNFKAIMFFVKNGKASAKVQVTPEQRQEMMKHIVELDPLSAVDKSEV